MVESFPIAWTLVLENYRSATSDFLFAKVIQGSECQFYDWLGNFIVEKAKICKFWFFLNLPTDFSPSSVA